MDFTRSKEMLAGAKELIPTCSQTFSKSYEYFPEQYPVYIERGNGAHVTDVDGNHYLDMICGLGAVTLGYRDAQIDQEIINQIAKGISFSLPHRLELELAEKLAEIIPCAEMVKFSKTGSEVCSAAVKIARAYTGRDVIASWGYHGWHDWWSIISDRDSGIPPIYRDYIKQFEYNDLLSLEALFHKYPKQIAAVFLEPCTFTEPNEGYLQDVIDMAHNYGALVIFDEMVTGFRWTMGGAQEYFNVIPDLATFGKGIANGMPLAAVAGSKEIMMECEDVFFSTTFGGEALSLAAALATINKMDAIGYINHIWELGRLFKETAEKIEGLSVKGFPCRPMIMLDADTAENRALLMQEMCKQGVLMHSGGINFTAAHREKHIRFLTAALRISMADIRRGKVKLEGRLPMMSFRRI